MNWEFIVEYLPLYEKATVLTVRIGLLGIAVSQWCNTIGFRW